MKKKLLAMSVLAAISSQAGAFEIDTSDDWSIRWDNTLKANAMVRVDKQDRNVYDPVKNPASAALADDADLSVKRGNLISSRLDVLSEMDIVYKSTFGVRVSGAGWYDYQYGNNNNHPGFRSTWASPSVKPGEYNSAAEDLHYFGGELLDAFVFANFDIGENISGNLRAGRHTIYWGQSLLATGAIHGFASAMAPLDFAKAFAVPGSEAKELFLPTNKISTVVQLTDNLTFNAFYGFEHRTVRLPETGTYFSPAEGLTEDTEFVTLVPGEDLRVGLNVQNDKTDDGDWGVNFQYYVEPLALETSFIYMNYTDKIQNGLQGGIDFGQFAFAQAGAGSPSAQALIGAWLGACGAGIVSCPTPPDVNPAKGTVTVGNARWVYKNDIDIYGISLSKEIAGISFGMDLVRREGVALAPELSTSLGRTTNIPELIQPLVPQKNWDYTGASSGNYLNATGDTYEVVINALGLLNGQWGLWDGGSYIVEATFSKLDKCTSYCKNDPDPQNRLQDKRTGERWVSQIGIVFKPTWYQMLPGWDMSVPMSVSYTMDGQKAYGSFGGDEEAGNGSIGLEFDINQIWNLSAKYNIFFGPAQAGIGGLLTDRDNVSLTLKRTL